MENTNKNDACRGDAVVFCDADLVCEVRGRNLSSPSWLIGRVRGAVLVHGLWLLLAVVRYWQSGLLDLVPAQKGSLFSWAQAPFPTDISFPNTFLPHCPAPASFLILFLLPRAAHL